MSDTNFDADLDRNNFEKLCGKNGELVELRRKQMLIGAARLLKVHCKEHGDCDDCLFLKARGCLLRFPAETWDLPEV